MKTCSNCHALNEEDVVFCAECGSLLRGYSREEIEQRQATGLCPECHTYNPVEADTCTTCGRYLRGDSVVLTRDDGGRLHAMRRKRVTVETRAFLIASTCLLVGGGLWALVWRILRRGLMVDDSFTHVLLAYIAVVIVMGYLEWESDLSYKFRSVLVLSLIVVYWAVWAAPKAQLLPGLGVRRLAIWAELVVVVFAIFRVLQITTAGNVLMGILVFVGIYCAIEPAHAILTGMSYEDLMGGAGVLSDLPVYVQSTFVCFNFFLPYVFLRVFADCLSSIFRRKDDVRVALTVTRVLRWHTEALRGQVLNLFTVGLTLGVGWDALMKHNYPTLWTYLEWGYNFVSGFF